MAFDLDSLKEALGDEKFSALSAYIETITGQRDAARNESIDNRKALKAKLEKAEARVTAFEDWAGIDADTDLETLPAAKLQADEKKQLETKLARMQRERDEARQGRTEADGKYRNTLQRAAVAEATAAHKFRARDVVDTYIQQRLVWEGDELMFKGEGGKLIAVADGVAGFAKTHPELLEPTGAGGAGVRPSNAGSGGHGKTMARAEFEAMPPADRVAASKAGVQLT